MSAHVKIQHGLELLMEINTSLFEPDVFGCICIDTYVRIIIRICLVFVFSYILIQEVWCLKWECIVRCLNFILKYFLQHLRYQYFCLKCTSRTVLPKKRLCSYFKRQQHLYKKVSYISDSHSNKLVNSHSDDLMPLFLVSHR